MIFVLDTAIGLGVWIPFTIGKSTALLSVSCLTAIAQSHTRTKIPFQQLDPYRFLQLIHFPIRAMRVITDPVVDLILLLIVRFALPFLWETFCGLINVFALSGSFIASRVGGDRSDSILESLAAVVCSQSFVFQSTFTDQG